VIAIDTNILVYAHRSACPEHGDARKAVERAASNPNGWGLALPSISEFWVVVTHPSCEGGPSTPEQAGDFLVALIKTGGPRIFLPNETFATRLIRTAADLGVQGVRIFDLQIGLLSLEAGATEIWTHDTGFVRIPGLTIADPLS